MSLKIINIKRWINYETFETYKREIFEDDSLEDGIIKIALSINKSSRFYTWINNYPNLLFTIENSKWKGYDNNPLKSTDRNNVLIKEPIDIKINYGLCYFSKLNIIFEEDFKDLKNNQYYFIDKKFKNLDELNKNEYKLIELSKIENKFSDNKVIIHRYELKGKLKKYEYLTDIYDKLNTNQNIQYIQWINDNYTLIHKLYMYHSISVINLQNWSNFEKIKNNIKCINCYFPIDDHSYIKITINADMTFKVYFNIDLRNRISHETIETKYINVIITYLENSLGEKIKLEPLSIKIYNYINISNVTFEQLKIKISNYQNIFKIISAKKSINLIYKRSSNFTTEKFDIGTYIKNRLIFGVEPKDIVDELKTFDYTEEEANNLIFQQIELLGELQQQNIKEELLEHKLDTLVIIKQPKVSNFEIIVYNIPNKKEMDNLVFWISKIISLSQEKIKETKKKAIMVKEKSSTSSKKEDEEEDLGKLSFSSSGGAKFIDKDEDERYKITLLQNTDKDLFGKNYARDICQKKNQPLVINKETRDKLIEKNEYYVDNELYYGSKKDNMNYYICPRYWCVTSKVPGDPITGKCPIEDEKKIESFFLKPGEEGIKRYVQLIKPDEETNICAPCCFKKPPKKYELEKCKNYENYNPKNAENVEIEDKDENYLFDVNNVVAVGRYGKVQKELQQLLQIDTSSKSEIILVRKGINHKTLSKEENIHSDSLIFAITYLLNFENNKNKFIKDLTQKLDLITFLSLENGNVCKAFMDNLPIIPSENIKLINELKITFPTLKKFYKINYNKFDYKLSRLLAIFKSYKKFINYISSNNYSKPKSSYYFYSLISIIYNKLLVIWEKNNNNLSILCPYFTSFQDLKSILEINPEIIMLMYDGKYYEPLEIRNKKTKENSKIFKLNNYLTLKELLNSCSDNNKKYDINNEIYLNLYSLNSWIKTKYISDNYDKFIFKTILINNDLTIEHILTNGGILITFDKIGISFIQRMIKDLNIKEIAFYDDYVNVPLNIEVNLKELDILKVKLKSLGFSYDIGKMDETMIQREPIIFSYTILELKPKELGNNNIIHARVEDDLYFYDNNNYEENKKWFQLQLMVFKTILNNINEQELKRLQSLPRIQYINEILNFFKDNPYKNKIRIIIEEIPIYSINHIKNYLNKIIIYNKYDFLNPNIIKDEKRNQFQFSQVAIQNGIIPKELLNYHKSAPINNFINAQEKEFNFTYDLNKTEDLSKLPSLMKGYFEPLNSKWVIHKKSIWTNIQILKTINYEENYFKEFFEWYANFIGIKTNYNNLIEITFQKLEKYKNDYEIMKTLFKDKVLFNLYVDLSGRTFTNVNVYINKYYDYLTNAEKMKIIEQISKKPYIINDLTIYSMSEILNISILIIHRAPYKSTKDEDKRGELEDLIVSSTFCKAPNNYNNRPVLMLYKINKEYITNYYLVFNKEIIPPNSRSFYLKYDEVPDDIKNLLEEHLKIDKKKKIPLLKY